MHIKAIYKRVGCSLREADFEHAYALSYEYQRGADHRVGVSRSLRWLFRRYLIALDYSKYSGIRRTASLQQPPQAILMDGCIRDLRNPPGYITVLPVRLQHLEHFGFHPRDDYLRCR